MDTFEYMVDYLVGVIGPSVADNYGAGDTSPKRDKDAWLCDLFEKYIYAAGMGYCLMSEAGVLYVYNGRHYEMIRTETFLAEVVKKSLEKMGVGLVYQKISNKFIAKECLSGMENSASSVFRPDRRYIVFNNGVFDIKEGKLNDFDMKYRTNTILDIDYNADAVCPLWDTKLVEIIPNSEMREAFQMFCGMLLVDRTEIKIEYIAFVIGPGSNGKSVITSAVASVFGERYFAKFAPDQLLKSGDKMFNLASLDGMIANFTDDLDKEDISSKGFKRFASGESFEARHPFGRRVFKVKAPLMLCCTNEMPPTTDDSWGYHRRILPIYSSIRVWGEKDKDPYLGKKLSTAEARTAIFNWIYEGYKKIIANGGNISLGDDVIKAQMDLRDDSNSARRWIRDMGFIKVDPEGRDDLRWKSLIEWHNEYKQYCADNGDYNPKNSKSLSKLFKEKEFAQEHRRNGSWYCIGILGVDSEAPKPVVLEEDEDLPF